MKILVLGLGNDILGDDGVGLVLVRRLKGMLPPEVELLETYESGWNLLDLFVDQDAAILVDAIQTQKEKPGHIYTFDADSLSSLPSASPHFVGIPEVLEMGKSMGLKMPITVSLVAVEIPFSLEVGDAMTAPVKDAIPEALKIVQSQVEKLLSQPVS